MEIIKTLSIRYCIYFCSRSKPCLFFTRNVILNNFSLSLRQLQWESHKSNLPNIMWKYAGITMRRWNKNLNLSTCTWHFYNIGCGTSYNSHIHWSSHCTRDIQAACHLCFLWKKKNVQKHILRGLFLDFGKNIYSILTCYLIYSWSS